jgi:hypothetical protein
LGKAKIKIKYLAKNKSSTGFNGFILCVGTFCFAVIMMLAAIFIAIMNVILDYQGLIYVVASIGVFLSSIVLLLLGQLFFPWKKSVILLFETYLIYNPTTFIIFSSKRKIVKYSHIELIRYDKKLKEIYIKLLDGKYHTINAYGLSKKQKTTLFTWLKTKKLNLMAVSELDD